MTDLLIMLLAALLFASAADCLPFCVHPAFTHEARRRLSLAVGCGLTIAIVAIGYGVANLGNGGAVHHDQSALNIDVLQR